MAELELLLAGVSLATTVFGLSAQYFGTINKIKERLVRMETKIDLFWNIVEQEIPKILKSPHTARLDELLERFSAKHATDAELKELRKLLKQQINDFVPAQKLAAILTMARIDQMLYDHEELK